MNKTICPFIVAVVGLVGISGTGAAPPDDLTRMSNADTATKRQWLRENLVASAGTDGRARMIQEKLHRMSPQQIDVLAQRLAVRRAGQRLADARALRDRLLRQRLHARRFGNQHQKHRVGYAPVLSVLPSGTHMTAGAVVSPDRRHVRINVMALFSSIGPVDTFNFHTGRTRRQSPR